MAPAGAQPRSGRAGRGVRTPGGRGAESAGRRGIHGRGGSHHALGRLPLPGPVVRADRAGDGERDARRSVRARARAHVRASGGRRRAGRDREPACRRPGPQRRAARSRARADRPWRRHGRGLASGLLRSARWLDRDTRSGAWRSRHATQGSGDRRGIRRDMRGAARCHGSPRRLGQHRDGGLTVATRLSDPIGFELFKNTLLSIADEMALTILRTAYSGVLKDNMHYSTAFCAAGGGRVAQGLTLPGHLSSFPDALAATIKRYGNRMRPGDVYALNDPFEGGMHLPDVFILKPIFHEGRRVAFAATICHQTDMGGRVAGSNASDSTEIFQEGLRIPPVKMYDAGDPNETFFRMLDKTVRMPVRVAGDMRAQLAACHIAEEAFARLIAKHGVAQVSAYMEEILDYTERLTRAAIAELPDGEWSFTDWIDDDGIDFG